MIILVADDSRTMRRVFRNALETMGCASADILEAGDTVEALSVLKTRKFDVDLLIVDLDMPGMEGHGFLKRVKQDSHPRSIPVILCINPNQRRYAQEGSQYATIDLLERPFRDADLRAKLQTFEPAIRAKKTKEASDVLRTIVSTAEAEVDLPFLMQLPSYIMKELLQLASQSSHEQGAILLKAGHAVEALHIVSLGEVEIVDRSGKVVEVCNTGDCFAELAFMQGQVCDADVRARSWVQVISLPRHKLTELLHHQPKMSQYLSALVARRSKALSKPPAVASGTEFAGSLSAMSFADVLQLLQLGRKTGQLHLSGGKGKGEIVIESGEVRHASTGSMTGEDAFYTLAGWKDATFQFSSGRASGPKSITQPTMSLLMEAMRRIDEGQRSSPTDETLNALFGGSAETRARDRERGTDRKKQI